MMKLTRTLLHSNVSQLKSIAKANSIALSTRHFATTSLGVYFAAQNDYRASEYPCSKAAQSFGVNA